MRRRVLRLTLLAIFAVCGNCAEWRTNTFKITWADGFTRVPNDDPTKLQFLSDGNIGVTLTVIGHHEKRAEEFQRFRDSFTQYAKVDLVKAAKRHGKIVMPLKREDLQNHVLLFTMGGYESRTDNFGLYYLAISPEGRVAQIVVEGPGRPEDKLLVYRKYLDSAQWAEEQNQSPQPPQASGPRG
jgi:hypothetical protein